MPVEIQPPELAQLVDFSERSRVDDWSLRSALVRYAQPQPERVNDILDLVRRIEFALHAYQKTIEQDGPEVWNALKGLSEKIDGALLGLLRAAQAIDALGDDLAAWACDRSTPRPDDEVDEVVEAVAQQLEILGVPHEERPPGPRGRGV